MDQNSDGIMRLMRKVFEEEKRTGVRINGWIVLGEGKTLHRRLLLRDDRIPSDSLTRFATEAGRRLPRVAKSQSPVARIRLASSYRKRQTNTFYGPPASTRYKTENSVPASSVRSKSPKTRRSKTTVSWPHYDPINDIIAVFEQDRRARQSHYPRPRPEKITCPRSTNGNIARCSNRLEGIEKGTLFDRDNQTLWSCSTSLEEVLSAWVSDFWGGLSTRGRHRHCSRAGGKDQARLPFRSMRRPRRECKPRRRG